MWIARDEDGMLYLYNSKPIKREDTNWWDLEDGDGDGDNYVSELDPRLFSEVTYENSPQEVNISIINKGIEFYEG